MKWLGVLLLCSAMVGAEPVKLVTGSDYPPFTDSKLPDGGLATVRVQRAFAAAGVDSELFWRPWANGYKATLQGEFAATFPYIRTPEREAEFLYSQPLFELRLFVFGRLGENLNGSQPATLRGKRYCQPLGWAVLPAIEALIKRGELYYHRPNDMAACMRLIALNYSDFTVTDHAQGLQLLGQLPATGNIIPLGEVMSVQTLHLIVPKAAPGGAALLQQFNTGLQRLGNKPAQ
ncbi:MULTISPECIES: ABC transporter substrate-binding protein [Chitinibacter]|nr:MULTISPECIES: transporter substrate-binding domain-containing protein [Chitinibacter]